LFSYLVHRLFSFPPSLFLYVLSVLVCGSVARLFRVPSLPVLYSAANNRFPRLCVTIVSRAGAEYKLPRPKETAVRVFQFFSSGESQAVNSCCSRISLASFPIS
jgi:hypothetical protein